MNSLIALLASAAYTDLTLARDDEDEEEENDLDNDETEEETPVETKSVKTSKKKMKKGGKKVAKKEGKKSASKPDKSDKDVVRLKDLAKEAKLTEAVTRKKLRDADVPRGEGRWSWEKGSKALKQARKALDLKVA